MGRDGGRALKGVRGAGRRHLSSDAILSEEGLREEEASVLEAEEKSKGRRSTAVTARGSSARQMQRWFSKASFYGQQKGEGRTNSGEI